MPEIIKKHLTVDRWRRLGSEILKNNFILTWNHGLCYAYLYLITACRINSLLRVVVVGVNRNNVMYVAQYYIPFCSPVCQRDE